MNEDELRALVREAIARHGAASPNEVTARAPAFPAFQHHASHGLFVVPSGGDAGGACLIEPAVLCSHCGYCKSWGH